MSKFQEKTNNDTDTIHYADGSGMPSIDFSVPITFDIPDFKAAAQISCDHVVVAIGFVSSGFLDGSAAIAVRTGTDEEGYATILPFTKESLARFMGSVAYVLTGIADDGSGNGQIDIGPLQLKYTRGDSEPLF